MLTEARVAEIYVRPDDDERRMLTGGGNNGRRRRQYTPSSSGRGGPPWAHGMLPSWYPRRPLADISHIARAVERRRADPALSVDPADQEEEDPSPCAATRVFDRLKNDREKKKKTLMSMR